MQLIKSRIRILNLHWRLLTPWFKGLVEDLNAFNKYVSGINPIDASNEF